MQRLPLLDLERSEVLEWAATRDIPGYRADQLLSWVYQHACFTPAEMTNLPGDVRRLVEQELLLAPFTVEHDATDPGDGTRKWLFALADGHPVETVAIPSGTSGYTLCISSQSGCGLGCTFCATGQLGFRRNLTAGEIVAQVLWATHELGRPDNIVYMGMGEPLQNYDAVVASLRRLVDPRLFDMGQRRITVSTAGMVPEIYRLAREALQVNLAISIGGTTDTKRAELIPLGRVYNLERVLRAADDYVEHTQRRVSYEYLLIRGKSDSRKDAERLAELLSKRLAHVNLILWNKVPGIPFDPPDKGTAAKFRRTLEQARVPCTLRQPRGRRIDAACGQLAAGAHAKASSPQP